MPDLVPKLAPWASSRGGAGRGRRGRVRGLSAYAAKGARLEADALGKADVVVKVQPPTPEEIARLKEGALIGLLQPYTSSAVMTALAARNITAFSMDPAPHHARAAMDALSAMSTVAGYKRC